MIRLICPTANLDGSGENQMQWGAHQKAEENVSSSGMQRDLCSDMETNGHEGEGERKIQKVLDLETGIRRNHDKK